MAPSTARRTVSALLGIAAVAALLLLLTRAGDAARFVELARAARPGWLLVAIVVQVGNYPAKAALLDAVLRRGAVRVGFGRLCELSLVALFTSATVPSAGLAGTWLLLRVLRLWGAPASVAVSAVLVDLVGYYVAYALFVAAMLAALVGRGPPLLLAAMAAAIAALAALASLGTLWLSSPSTPEVRWRWLAPIVDELAAADPALVRSPALLALGVGLRAAGFALDVATLAACLAAVGVTASAPATLCALMLGALARTLGVVPSGLGTFEAAVIGGYALFGVPLEPALAAALLFRGVSFWLPLVPGLWASRRLLR